MLYSTRACVYIKIWSFFKTKCMLPQSIKIGIRRSEKTRNNGKTVMSRVTTTIILTVTPSIDHRKHTHTRKHIMLKLKIVDMPRCLCKCIYHSANTRTSPILVARFIKFNWIIVSTLILFSWKPYKPVWATFFVHSAHFPIDPPYCNSW